MPFRRSLLYLSALPTFVVILDLLIRFSYLRVLEPSLLQHFLYSYTFEWTLCFVITGVIAVIRSRRMPVVIFTASVLSIGQLMVYGHYFYFGVLPNPYSINYSIDHTSDSLSLIISSITWVHAVIFVNLVIIHSILLRIALKGYDAFPLKYRWTIAGCFLGCVIIFNNNVRFAPASYSVSPATFFSLKYTLQERNSGAKMELHHGYVRRRFEVADRPAVRSQYNCILFISESLRKRNFSAYGYHRNTTPFIDSMISAGSVVRFHHHVSNAVSTQYSVPMILSGDFTISKIDHPFIYDYLKRWTDARTYFFTSQSMQRSNIDLVYNTSLDTFVCQEKLPYEPFNDLGVDDADVADHVKDFYRRHNGERFFSIIQFNNTHFPYTVKQSAARFFSTKDSAVIDSYDNTILEQDRILRSYFTAFGQAGLLDSTVIIFTSDHGEAFGERGHMGHLNTLYGEEIEVPMWIYLPKGFSSEKKKVIERNAQNATSHLDLFPTLMELFGIVQEPPVEDHLGGMSLLQPIGSGRIIPVVGKDMIDTKAVIAGTMKYIETNRDGIISYEAYDLSKDRAENRNLWDGIAEQQKQVLKEQFNSIDVAATAGIKK
ncbi:MAG: sulfatase-like hydrolase/transferase [Bacteroidota bacterium]